MRTISCVLYNFFLQTEACLPHDRPNIGCFLHLSDSKKSLDKYQYAFSSTHSLVPISIQNMWRICPSWFISKALILFSCFFFIVHVSRLSMATGQSMFSKYWSLCQSTCNTIFTNSLMHLIYLSYYWLIGPFKCSYEFQLLGKHICNIWP